jgi:hypothetical protein
VHNHLIPKIIGLQENVELAPVLLEGLTSTPLDSIASKQRDILLDWK